MYFKYFCSFNLEGRTKKVTEGKNIHKHRYSVSGKMLGNQREWMWNSSLPSEQACARGHKTAITSAIWKSSSELYKNICTLNSTLMEKPPLTKGNLVQMFPQTLNRIQPLLMFQHATVTSQKCQHFCERICSCCRCRKHWKPHEEMRFQLSIEVLQIHPSACFFQCFCVISSPQECMWK